MKTPSMTTMYEAVRFLAALYPDAKYVRIPNSIACFYTIGSIENGPKSSGCIVGQAMRLLRHPAFRRADFVDSIRTVSPIRTVMRGEDKKLLDWLQTVQSMQDAGYTWSYAVKEADLELRYLV